MPEVTYAEARMAPAGPTLYKKIDSQAIAALANNDPAAIKATIAGIKVREDVPGNLAGGNKTKEEAGQGYMAAKNLLMGIFDNDKRIIDSKNELIKQRVGLEEKLVKTDKNGPEYAKLQKQIAGLNDQVYSFALELQSNSKAAVWLAEKYIDIYDFDYSKLEFFQGKLKETEAELSHPRTQEEKTSAPGGFSASRGMKKTAAAISGLGGYKKTETEGGLSEQLEDIENRLVELGAKRITASLEPWAYASQAYVQASQALSQGKSLKSAISGLEEAAGHIDNLLPGSEAGQAVKNLIVELGKIADGGSKKDPQQLISNSSFMAAKAEEARKGFEASANIQTPEEAALEKRREEIMVKIVETEAAIAFYQNEIAGAEYFNKKWDTYVAQFNTYGNEQMRNASGQLITDINQAPVMGKKFLGNLFVDAVGSQHTTSWEGIASTGSSMWKSINEQYGQAVAKASARADFSTTESAVKTIFDYGILNPGEYIDGFAALFDLAWRGPRSTIGWVIGEDKSPDWGFRRVSPFGLWATNLWEFSKELFNFSPTGEPVEKWKEVGGYGYDMTSIPAHDAKNEAWKLASEKPTPHNIKMASVQTQVAWVNTGMLALSAVPIARTIGETALEAFYQSMKPLLLKRLELDITANVLENAPRMVTHFQTNPSAKQLLSKATMSELENAAKTGGPVEEALAKKVGAEVAEKFKGIKGTPAEMAAAISEGTGFKIQVPSAIYTVGQTAMAAADYVIKFEWTLPIARGIERVWMQGVDSPVSIQIAALANEEKQAVKMTVDEMVNSLKRGGMSKVDAVTNVRQFIADNADAYLSEMRLAFRNKFGIELPSAKAPKAATGGKAAQAAEDRLGQELYRIIEFKDRMVDALAKQKLKEMKLKAQAKSEDLDAAREMAIHDIDNVFKKYFYITVDKLADKPIEKAATAAMQKIGKAKTAVKRRGVARKEAQAATNRLYGIQNDLERMAKSFNEQFKTDVAVSGKRQALKNAAQERFLARGKIPEMPNPIRILEEAAPGGSMTETGRIAWKEFWAVANDVTKGILDFKEHGKRLLFKSEKMKDRANKYLAHLAEKEEEVGGRIAKLRAEAEKNYGIPKDSEQSLTKLLDNKRTDLTKQKAKLEKKHGKGSAQVEEMDQKIKGISKPRSEAEALEKEADGINDKVVKVTQFVMDVEQLSLSERPVAAFFAMYDQIKAEGAFSMAPTWMQTFRKTLQEKTLLGRWDELSSEARQINKRLNDIAPKISALRDESPEIQSLMREAAGKNRILTPSDYQDISDAIAHSLSKDEKLIAFRDLCQEYGDLIGRRVAINWERRGLFALAGVPLAALPVDIMALNAEFSSSAAAALADYYAIWTAYSIFTAMPTTIALPLMPLFQQTAQSLPPKMDLSGWVPKPTGKMNASPGTYTAPTDRTAVAAGKPTLDSNRAMQQPAVRETVVAQPAAPVARPAALYTQTVQKNQPQAIQPTKKEEAARGALDAMAALSMPQTRNSILLAIGINEGKKDLNAKEKAFLKMLKDVQDQDDKQKAAKDLMDIRGAIQAALNKAPKSSDAQAKKQQQILGTLDTEGNGSYNKDQFMRIMNDLF